MPTYRIIRADGCVDYVDADWCDEQPTGWTLERVVHVAWEPRWAVVRRLSRRRVIAVHTD